MLGDQKRIRCCVGILLPYNLTPSGKTEFVPLSDTYGIVCFNNYNFLFNVAYKEFG